MDVKAKGEKRMRERGRGGERMQGEGGRAGGEEGKERASRKGEAPWGIRPGPTCREKVPP